VLNALVSLNLFDADYGVGGGRQANPFGEPTRKNREAQAEAGAGLLDTGLVRGGLDDTRPNGAACGYAGLVG